jgi:aminoglycoside phosphotransferase (APT) family kinase protein
LNWRRGLHPLLNPADVSQAVHDAVGYEPLHLIQKPVKPPRIVYEVVFQDRQPLIFKAEVAGASIIHDIALEGWALQQADRVGIPVPQVVHQDSSEHRFPFRYLIMTKIEGGPLDETNLTEAQLTSVLAEASDWLVRLHSIAVQGYGWLDEELYLSTGTIKGTDHDWNASIVAAGIKTLQQLRAVGLVEPHDFSILEERLARAWIPAHPPNHLMNGDFDGSQIFVTSDGRPTGLIDFGARESAPREWEFATVLLWDEPLLDALLAGYEAALGQRLDRALIPIYTIAKLLQMLQRRLDRGDLVDARRKAKELLRFLE